MNPENKVKVHFHISLRFRTCPSMIPVQSMVKSPRIITKGKRDLIKQMTTNRSKIRGTKLSFVDSINLISLKNKTKMMKTKLMNRCRNKMITRAKYPKRKMITLNFTNFTTLRTEKNTLLGLLAK